MIFTSFIGIHQKNFDRDFNIYLTDYLDIQFFTVKDK